MSIPPLIELIPILQVAIGPVTPERMGVILISGIALLLISGCLLALIAALILFIWDINLGLAALNRDLGDLNG